VTLTMTRLFYIAAERRMNLLSTLLAAREHKNIKPLAVG